MHEYEIVRDDLHRPPNRQMLRGLDPLRSVLVLTNPKGGQIDLPIRIGRTWEQDFRGKTMDGDESFQLVERNGKWWLQTELPLKYT